MKKFFLLLLLFSFPLSSLALNEVDMDLGLPGIGSTDDFLNAMVRVANVMFVLLMLLTVIFVIYAAYLFLTAVGDDDKIKKARKVLIYAIVAVVVALFAGGFTAIIRGFVLDDNGGNGGGYNGELPELIEV